MIFSFIFLYFHAAGILWASEQVLSPGQQFTIPVDIGARFSIGNPSTIQVKSLNQEGKGAMLLVRAKNIGFSDLFILGKNKNQQWTFRVEKKPKLSLGGEKGQVPAKITKASVIRFKVRILELLRTTNENHGFLWSQSIPNIIAIHQKILRGSFSLESTLNLLTTRGFARLLSEPTITVNSQGIAELRVGGEIPIVFHTRNTQSVLWKNYGLQLKIEVPGSLTNLVRTRLSVDVSSLDMANAVSGIPAIKLNHLDTIVDLDTGKTAFLSGLIQDQEGTTIESLPVLGDIPVLGALFRSKNFLSRKSELVIAITAQN